MGAEGRSGGPLGVEAFEDGLQIVGGDAGAFVFDGVRHMAVHAAAPARGRRYPVRF